MSPLGGGPVSAASAESGPGFGAEPQEQVGKRWLRETGGSQLGRQKPRRRQRRHGKPRERFSALGQACQRWSDRPVNEALRGALRDAWADWIRLNGPWDWFITLTFKEDVSVEQGLRLLNRWLARLAQASRDKSGHQAVLTCVCAVEWTTNRRVHLHLVARAPGLDEQRRKRWQHTWEETSYVCGMARIHPARRRAVPYLTKYLGKGGLLHVRGRFVGWHPTPPSSSA
jgi:hypothetical protein